MTRMWQSGHYAAPVSKEVVSVLLLALAGFLIGGVYSTWKTARFLSIVLLVAAVLAAAGAIARFVG
jgi:hypothetical protein